MQLNNNTYALTSIVLPVYNHGEFLQESIKSVLSQDPIFELIIVNDGSTEPKVEEILNDYRSHPNIRIINQENKGVASALNRGFAEATGHFLTWISADNRFKDGALKEMSQFLMQHPKTSLVYANVNLINESGQKHTGTTYRPENLLDNGCATLRLPKQSQTLWEFPDNFINACFLYRREHANFIGSYNSDYRGFEDYDYWLRLSFTGELTHIGISEALYDYRIHSESLTSDLSWDKLNSQSRELLVKVREHKKLLEQPLHAKFTLEKDQSCSSLVDILRCFRIPSEIEAQNSKQQTLSLHSENEKIGTAEINEISIDANDFDSTMAYLPFAQSNFSLIRLENEKRGEKRQLYLAPIANQPRILLRARDDNFAAVSTEEKNKRTVILFTPKYQHSKKIFGLPKSASDKQLARISEIIKSHPTLTFVLFCQSKSERTSADIINQLLTPSYNKNLRIIDVSGQETDQLKESTLYALSSVDCILSTSTENTNLTKLLELRLMTIQAALADIPVLTLCGEIKNNNKHASSLENDFFAYLKSDLQNAPHFHLLEETRSKGLDLTDQITRISTTKTNNAVDEWLSTSSKGFLGKQTVSFFACP